MHPTPLWRASLALLSLSVGSAVAHSQSIPVETMGPGTITAPGARNYQGSFTGDGREFYFFRKVGEGEDYRVYRSVLGGSAWGAAERLDLGGDFSDLYPAITQDGRTLVFSSYRPLPGHPSNRPQAHLWAAERTAAGFGPARPLEWLNRIGYYHSGVRFDGDGVLRWIQQTPDYATRVHLAAATFRDAAQAPAVDSTVDQWQRRLPAGHRLWVVTMNPGGDLAILGVSQTEGRGRDRPSDFWVSLRTAAGWSAPALLPANVNTPGWENFAVFSPDGRTLHFNRDFASMLAVRVDDVRRWAGRR